jgi:hypothetical protein
MALGKNIEPTFDNIFNLITDDIRKLEIKENYNQDKCLIREKDNHNKYYNSFILDENSRTKIICTVNFYRSSQTDKYLPRLTFKKTDINLLDKEISSNKPINISFNKSEQSLIFWKLIGFLNSFKEIVELGEFDKSYQVVSRDAYFIEFADKNEQEQIKELKDLINQSDLNEKDIKNLVFEARKGHVRAFYYLLKNKIIKGKIPLDFYQSKYDLRGEEAVWHHFLKRNDWILGLNVDIKFIRDFYDEQKVGLEDSKGRLSPKSDLLGISDYTTLIELKHSNTKIFKIKKTNKSRANTWDFSEDFIEGISQCLGQKTSIDKSYDLKEFIDENKTRLDKNKHRNLDCKVVFIIGNRKNEFPHDNQDDNIIKSETFERFRRNIRNIDIITYDELFERAYHLVYSKKIQKDWFKNENINLE